MGSIGGMGRGHGAEVEVEVEVEDWRAGRRRRRRRSGMEIARGCGGCSGLWIRMVCWFFFSFLFGVLLGLGGRGVRRGNKGGQGKRGEDEWV